MAHRQEHAAFDQPFLDRRRLLQGGGLGCLGLTLSQLLQTETARAGPAAATRSADAIQSCILIFYYGGPSQLDTWDLKPGAPAEIRGEFRPIATRVPGLHIGEHLP